MKKGTEITVGGRKIQLSNLEKVFYPKSGFTKGQVIDYYIRISGVLLAHLKDRTITLKRYPNGVEGTFFYEKRCPSYHPPWLKTQAVWSEGNGEYINFCVFNDLASLVWAANLAVLELHTYLARAKDILKPTMIAFDLDPGPPANVVDCAQVALWLRTHLEKLGLESFPKTSGSKGIQIYVPLNSNVTYDQTKGFAREMAQRLEADHPDRVTSNMRKDLRVGKVFVDWSQNDDHKTTVCVYSLRAREYPTVSTPVDWSEIHDTAKKKAPELLRFEAEDVLKRTEESGDPFAPVLKLKQKLRA